MVWCGDNRHDCDEEEDEDDNDDDDDESGTGDAGNYCEDCDNRDGGDE